MSQESSDGHPFTNLFRRAPAPHGLLWEASAYALEDFVRWCGPGIDPHAASLCYRERLEHDYGGGDPPHYKNWPEIYRDLYGADETGNDEQIRALALAGVEAGQLVGTRVDLAPVFGRDGQRIDCFMEIRPGIWEGLVELQWWVTRPERFSGGVFVQPDRDGVTLSERIGEAIPIWTIRMTPDSARTGSACMLIGATQRIITPTPLLGVSHYRNAYNTMVRDSLGKTDTIEDIYTSFHQSLLRYGDSLRYPTVYFRTLYLYRGLPGDWAMRKIAQALHAPMEEVTLVLGIQLLQHLGYKRIRIADERNNDFLSRHARGADKITPPFSLDQLCRKYFDWAPSDQWPKYPFELFHTGRQLGLPDRASDRLPSALRAYLMGVSKD